MPTCASGNTHIGLGPSLNPEMAYEPALVPLSHSVGNLGGKPTKLGQTVDSRRALSLALAPPSHSP